MISLLLTYKGRVNLASNDPSMAAGYYVSFNDNTDLNKIWNGIQFESPLLLQHIWFLLYKIPFNITDAFFWFPNNWNGVDDQNKMNNSNMKCQPIDLQFEFFPLLAFIESHLFE